MTWIPAALPEDADWVMVYGLDPDMIDKTVQDEDGNDVVIQVPDLPENAKTYFWVQDLKAWAMNPNTEPPGDGYYWDFLEKARSELPSERPGDNYFFNSFIKEWQEFTPPTE
jgi:hypothetical protein